MEDWRLNGQEYSLFQKELHLITFKAWRSYDHAHCDFCWAKFSENEDDLHSGYATKNEEHWICESCYNDFKDRFQWTLCDSLDLGD